MILKFTIKLWLPRWRSCWWALWEAYRVWGDACPTSNDHRHWQDKESRSWMWGSSYTTHASWIHYLSKMPRFQHWFFLPPTSLLRLRQQVNVVIQKDPLKPKVTAAFLAFMKGLQLGCWWSDGLHSPHFLNQMVKKVMQVRYLASPKYFHTRGAGGMMVPYRPLSLTDLTFAHSTKSHEYPPKYV